jgi:CubicO group peptidase (beta-lactamase class C family)
MKQSIRFLFLSIFSFHILQAQHPYREGFIRDSLDNYIEKNLKDWQIPGLAVCVVKDGQVVVMKGYGVKEMAGSDKVDENTLFMIGSNTKAFTATALCMLDNEKKLSLNDKVTKWLPEFKLNNKAAGEMAIVRDLLCHRIGFQTFQGDFTYWTSNLSRDQVIEKMGHIVAAYPFRTRWGYTNAAFVAAGQIIPKATGISWEDFLRTRIFQPLGMNNTLALSSELPSAKNKALPHTMQNDRLIKIPIGNIDNLAPAGSISTSVNDFSKWIRLQLDNGKLNGQQIIPASVINETRRPQSILGDYTPEYNEGHFLLYGLGFLLQEYEARKIVSHTGGVNGYVSSVTLVPEENLGIVVFTNTDQNGFYEALKWEIMDAYLNLPFRNYGDTYLKRHLSNVEEDDKKDKALSDSAALHTKSSLPLAAYTGTYNNDVYGKMDVVLENGNLRMKFSHHPNIYAGLQPLGGNRFYAVFSDPEFSTAVFPFMVENQKVVSVTVKVADFIEYGGYEFKKTN